MQYTYVLAATVCEDKIECKLELIAEKTQGSDEAINFMTERV
jgi:hypothetical protein